MGGDDSQKLLPWRGIHSSPGRKPPAQLRINNVTETAGWNLARGTPSFWPRPQVQTAWVTFGKQRRVNSAARRRALGKFQEVAGACEELLATRKTFARYELDDDGADGLVSPLYARLPAGLIPLNLLAEVVVRISNVALQPEKV